MSRLRAILREVRRELQAREKVRTDSQADMRMVTSLSKQAILLIHQKKSKEARKLLDKSKQIILKLNDLSSTHPDIIYRSGLFSAALQEYSEASIFLALVEESRLVTPDEISVPSTDYVLGMADVIGEYRRLTLDALREGKVRKSESYLRTMDDIYVELMGMDESYMLVSGLRRKCDVARKIIEITRGDVTQEIRRSMLETHLRRLEKEVVRTKARKLSE
jgi:translin